MRIVQLNPFYFPYAGGIERRIRSTSQRLSRRHEVHIVTAQLPGTSATPQREGDVWIHRVPSTFPLKRFYNPPLVRTRGLQEVLERIDPDVIDYHFRWSPSWNQAFRNAPGARVITYHNTYGEGHGLLGLASRLNDRRYMATLAHARRIVCVSDRVRQDLLAHGAPAGKLRLVYNAVERTELDAIQGPPTTLPAGTPYAVSVGRMVRLKGLDLLIDAWPKTPKDLHLVLVGQGPKIAAWKKRAQRRGVGHRVHFTGWTEEAEKIRLLKHAEAYLHPARFESFPFALLEAMACGAPIVAAAIGGIPEAVGEAGDLLPHDATAWATAATRLHQDPALRKSRRQASLDRIQRFDWDAITKELEAVYEEAHHG